MNILFKMFVLCYFCNIDMYFFDKINVLYFTLHRSGVFGFNKFIHRDVSS